MTTVNPAFKLRKEGKLKEAEKVAKEYLEKDPNNEWNKKAYGWILFDKLKNALRKQRKLNKFNKMSIREFLNLGIPTPDILYANILKILLRFYRKGDHSALYQIYLIIKTFPSENFFKPEDFLRSKEGRAQRNSLVESVAVALARHSLNLKEPESLEFSLNWIEQVESRFPDNINLPYYRARILLQLEQYDKAIPVLHKLVAIRDDWHLWGYLGQAYEKIDPQKSAQCLCKALVLQKDPYLTIKFRINLVRILFQLNKNENASSEVKYISKLLEIRNIPPKEEIENFKVDPKFVKDAPEKLPQSFYEEYANQIQPDYSHLDLVHGVVVDVNSEKRKTAFVENGIIYLGDWNQFQELQKLEKGQKVDFRALKRKNYFGILKKIEKRYEFNPKEFPLIVGVWTRDQQNKERGFFYSANYKRIPILAKDILNLTDNLNDVVIGTHLFTYRSFEKRKWKNKELYFLPQIMKEKESEIIIQMEAKIKYIDPDKKYYIAENKNQEQVFIPGQVMTYDAMEGYEFLFHVYEGYDKKKKNRAFRAISIIKKLSPQT
ncbi:MAG: tetratricopeptide repeat protein [Leptonema sp. (in: bacteria)]